LDLDIDDMTAPTVDELDVDANRKDWFNLSDLDLTQIVPTTRTETSLSSNQNQKIRNARATIAKVTGATEGGTPAPLYAGTSATQVTDYVTITIASTLAQAATNFATYGSGVLSGSGISVTSTATAPIYDRTQNDSTDTENDTATMTAIGHTAPYDVILGCYTWECIYSSQHPFVATSSSSTTSAKNINASNAATFGNLIYDAASIKDYRQDGYTQIVKKFNDIATTTTLYAIPKRTDDGSAAIERDAEGLHNLDWYLTLGTAATPGMLSSASPSTDDEIRAKFWYDILIDYAENTSEIEVDRQPYPTVKQVHPYISVGIPIDASGSSPGTLSFNTSSGVFTSSADVSNNKIGASLLRANMLQKNLESVIVNIMNWDGSRKWNDMTLTGEVYTLGDTASGTEHTTYDSAILNVSTQTKDDLSLTFNPDGVLTGAVIPIAPTGSAGTDEMMFRANLDVKFILGAGGSELFAGQVDKTVNNFMAAITVDVSDDPA